MSLLTNIKKSWNNYLERLAKENKEVFPDGKPSCCSGKQQSSSAGPSGSKSDESR